MVFLSLSLSRFLCLSRLLVVRVEFEKAPQPYIFKSVEATNIVQELSSRCRFISLMETSNEEQRDEYGRTELHLAVLENNVARASEISRLSARKHIIINAIDNTGSSPLHYAAARGILDVVAVLLEGMRSNSCW
jgi:hypothetical protein